MTDLAENILKYIDKKGEAKSTDLARDLNESIQRIVGAIKSLECLDNVVEASIETAKRWELTGEGEAVKQNGSHEAVVHGLVPAEGIGQAQLMQAAGPVGKVGFSKAMSAGWITIDKSGGQAVVKRKVETVVDAVKEHLVLICDGKDGGVISDKERNEYKKRKLVEEVTEKIYVLKKGKCFSTTVEKPETDLTAEMIASGSWKTTKFKAYNLDSLGIETPRGHLHPLLKVRKEYRQIFLEMGFKEMPTNNFVESSFWNFDALFQPQQHPARDAHDTFFISDPATSSKFPKEYMERVKQVHSNGGFGSQGYGYDWSVDEASKNLLRTHTTAVSARMLYKLANQKEFKPQKYFSIDRVFRNETLDATHLAEFHQIEGVIADRGLTLGDLIGVLNQFFNKLGIEKIRFKPAYNPYTEPSMEIFSWHEGLGKWMELGNSGIFRPEMLLPMGLPPDVNVIAWGLSLERPTMIKYKIDNIRDLVGHKVNLKMVQENPLCRLDKSNDDSIRQLDTLERRWDKVDSSLDILKQRMQALGINPDHLKSSKSCQLPRSKDMVIYAHPSRPPYSLQLLASLLSAKMAISCSTHLHSSLTTAGPSLLPTTSTPRSQSILHLTLIWADVSEPRLVSNPNTTVQGEANICRYLSRALEGCQGGCWYENLPLDQVMAVDMVLDSLGASTSKHSALKTISQLLNKATFLVGEKPTVADLVALSLVKVDNIEVPAVDKWIQQLAKQGIAVH